MSKLPIIDAATFEKLLYKLGFKAVRQKGSHVFYKHLDGRYTTLPHHKGRDIGRSLIRQILREIKLSPDDFQTAVEEI
jgi:predicted RNA binding protein YcfA (HicA-like mRNA interferase family)